MSATTICFLGTPDFAVPSLQQLLRDSRFHVAGVISQPDRPRGRKLEITPSPIKALALSHQIPVLTPERVSQNLEEIKALKADLAVVVAFGQILPKAFLELFPLGAVNVHGSLLPRWRGASPIQRALEAGDKFTGVTLQKIVHELDAGDILGTRTMPLALETNAKDVFEKLSHLGAELLKTELVDYAQGNLVAVPQDPQKVTLAPKIQKQEGLLHWELPAEILHNKVRAFVAGPGTWTFLRGKKIKIHGTQILESEHAKNFGQKNPGTLFVEGSDLFVGCGQGILKINELQEESRKRVSAADFIKGFYGGFYGGAHLQNQERFENQ